MPFCPNPSCDHRKRLGEPAEFINEAKFCSDCGSSLSTVAPVFETLPESETISELQTMPKPQSLTDWKCPECGSYNREDLAICGCGYNSNSPFSTERQQAAESELEQAPEVSERQNEMKIEFRGSAREYFPIWIVNLCLTLLTLGIFSAWAKVRKKRYSYSRTMLDGTPFQYLGQPIPILKGRLIAAIAVITYYLSNHFFTSLLPYVFAVGAVLAPWVIVRSAAFNARYSAFRNMTFHFDGGYLDALKVLYALGIIPIFALGTAFNWWGKNVIAGIVVIIFSFTFPWWIRRLKNFLTSHSSYGGRKGIFSATGGQFFSVYFKSGLIMVAALIVGAIITAMVVASMTKNPSVLSLMVLIPMYAGYVLAYAYIQAHSTNLAWNHTRLGPLRFDSTLTGSGMAKLYVINALAIIGSLGMLIPWAVMRTLKYRADHMRVLLEGALVEFQGSDKTAVEASGAETLDFFDMDISL